MKDYSNALLGAICGDIIGSYYESKWRSTKRYNFTILPAKARFTDDTVMTIAVAEWLMNGGNVTEYLQKWGRKYHNAGYGGNFYDWIFNKDPQPYNSFGNGSAMRVSPVGWVFDTLKETLEKAKESAEVTHNHPEGIKGAQAVAAAIFMARNGSTKDEIKSFIEERFGYDLSRSYSDIQPTYHFHVSCQKSVPESIICFLESSDYEDAVRRSVSMGGDTDTMAAIAGSIATAYYDEIPEEIKNGCLERLTPEIKDVINRFTTFLRV